MTLSEAVHAIESGLVVGVPTDTVYGLAVDPFNEVAIARLFEIKGRPTHKPIGLLVATLEQAGEIGHLDESAMSLANRHWPGALTLVVRPRVVMADWVGDRQRNTVGLRMPDHEVALGLLVAVGPLAVTSANASGEPDSVDDEEARAIFGDSVALYIRGRSPGGVPSTVVDATTERLAVLREGSVSLGS